MGIFSACRGLTQPRRGLTTAGLPSFSGFAMTRIVVAFGLILLGAGPAHSLGVHEHLFIGTRAGDEGRLHVFEVPEIISVPLTFCQQGQCLYSGLAPAFTTEELKELPRFLPLSDGVELLLVVLSMDPGLTIKFNGVVYRQPTRVLLGSSPGLHAHPSWQIVLPAGSVGNFLLRFRVESRRGEYLPSPEYAIVFTNAPLAPSPTPTIEARTPTFSPSPPPTQTATSSPTETPTPLPTSSHTPSPTPSPSPSPTSAELGPDANGDGRLTVTDLVQVLLSTGGDLYPDGLLDARDEARLFSWIQLLFGRDPSSDSGEAHARVIP